MKKWPLLSIVAGLVVIGCAGGGEQLAPGGTGGGGTTGRSTASPNLTPGNHGLVMAWFLPGQGRAPGDDVTVEIQQVNLKDQFGQTFPDNGSVPPLFLLLNGYDALNREVDVDPMSQHSRTFDDFEISFREVKINNSPRPNSGEEWLIFDLLNVTAFPGRESAIQFYLNDAMINEIGGQVFYDEQLFLDSNIDPSTGKIEGFLADYVRFDISNVPVKPTLAGPNVAGQPAQFVYISGDGYALSEGGTEGHFEFLTPTGVFEGSFYPPDVVSGNFGTYDLTQADPRFVDPPEPRFITALKGRWRDFALSFNSAGQFEFVAFPKSGDGAKQEIAIVQRNLGVVGSPIVAMWFGQLDYSTGTFKAYSINQVQPASTANEITGTIGAFKNFFNATVVPGAANWWRSVRSGDFTFNNPPAGIPAGFNTGRFVVYRL